MLFTGTFFCAARSISRLSILLRPVHLRLRMSYPSLHSRSISAATRGRESVAPIKAQQEAKIRNIAQALAVAGIVGLDEQAKALGLRRSTAWNICRANHKKTGISAAIIDRMLASPTLPASVRATIIEYVEEKAAGLYGHSRAQRRRFVRGLASNLAARRRLGPLTPLQPEMDFKKIISTAQSSRHSRRRYEIVLSQTCKELNVT